MTIESLRVFGAGDGFGKNRLDFMQQDAVVGAQREGGFTKITFPAGAFDQVADFKIEPALVPSLR